jgi:hypothetical protein
MNSFFQKSKNNEDPLYSQIRDCPKRSETKKQIECFWEKYRKYAQKSEQHFLSKIQEKGSFKQRWWEMALSVGLLNIGMEIQKKKTEEGPDILIYDLIKISPKTYIEAIAPKKGITEVKLPDMKFGVHDRPERKFLLRLSGAFVEKYKKYICYINNNIIYENDFYIIAISACDLSQYGSLMDYPPAPLKLLAGAGPLILSPSGNFFEYRPQIKKTKNTPVEMNYFLSKEYEGISAVLYSNVDVLNCPDKPEEKFVIVKNPIAKNPISNTFFEGIKSWTFDKKLKSWRSSNNM